jgi:hypothetical protein
MTSSASAPLSNGQGVGVRVAFGAVVGGTIEEIGGGKFANGAVTGSFTVLFNEMMHQIDIIKVNRAIADFEDLRLNGRMYSSESEAKRIAQYITTSLKIETHIFTLENSAGEANYFLDSFYNNSKMESRWNSFSCLKADGYSVTSEEHYSIYGPEPGKVFTASRQDWIMARDTNIPVTHSTIGLGQWTINGGDVYGNTPRFVPENFYFNNSKYFHVDIKNSF